MRTLALIIATAALAAADEGRTPPSIHQLEYELHRDQPTSPDLVSDADATIIPLSRRVAVSRPCATIFGYLPYWSSSTNLHYDLLTHIACFSVEVNANGTLGNDHGWPWTSVINNAHANGVKIILVATMFDSGDILTLITNTSYKNAFFANIKAKMLEGSADGLNIDFEGGGSSWKSHINTFMFDLTTYLHNELPGSEVTFAGPSVNWGNDWDLPGLAASCDGIFIMGYAFWGSWSSTSGPNAPLTGGTYNITDTVLDQYAQVTQNNPQKLILGVPYYGHRWKTATSDARSSVTSYLGPTWFYDDEPASQTYGLIWESLSQTPWYRWWDGSNWNQVWFDNADSLGLKYDLAISNNLQGVGMWALGYDGARPELWDQLALQFTGCGGGCCDMNDDGYVGADDVPLFMFCLQGPDATYDVGHFCLAGDTDEDSDVDMYDLAVFQQDYGN